MNGLRPRSLFEYCLLLWRRKFLIGVTAGVVLWATWATINRLPDVYESQALVVLSGLQTEEGRQAAAAKVTHLTQQVTSRSALVPLIERYGLYPDMQQDGQVNRMRSALKLETKVRNYYPEVAESVSISLRHHDPVIAQRVLGNLVGIFDQTNETAAQQASAEAREIGAKITEVEGQIRQLGAPGLAARSGYETGALRTERNAAAASIETLDDRQYALEERIKEQQREIAEQQWLLKAAPPNLSGAHGALLVRRAELEAQLKDYATQYTEKNPKVVQTRTQLSEINRQLVQLNAGGDGQAQIAVSPEGRELRTLERDLARMKIELEITQRELERRRQSLAVLPSVRPLLPSALASSGGEESLSGGATELGFLQHRYVALLDRQDRVLRALASPKELGLAPFRIVDQPNLPQTPVGPKRYKFKLIALGIALLCGLALAAALQAPRLRLIQDARDAEYYFGARVVALIPETLTPAERGKQRRLLLARTLAVCLLAAALVPVLALLFYAASRYFI